MKKLILLITAVALTIHMYAQAPEKLSYQAVVRDADNNLVTNQVICIQISILQYSEGGTAVYSEIQTPLSNAGGLISIEIGTGTTVNNFSDVDWSDGPYFVKTEIDPSGGTSYTITGTSQLLSVPYALYASEVGNIKETDPVYNASVAKGITSMDTSKWNDKLDDETQDLNDVLMNNNDAGNKNIVNIANPINEQDAATKAYVDNLINDLYAQGGLRLRDYDGNYYNTIRIGNQIWMAENLKTTHYSNGDTITGNYAYDDNPDNAKIYGRLYSWSAVMNGDSSSNLDPSGIQGVCPVGWHVPSDEEIKELEMSLGMSQKEADSTDWRGTNEGGKLKARGTEYWPAPNEGATNETGFTLLPGASRFSNGTYNYITLEALIWTCTESSISDQIYYRKFGYLSSKIYRDTIFYTLSYAVRCVKDY